FEKVKNWLISKVENLNAISGYESFLTAFQGELIDSKIKVGDLSSVSKEEVIKLVTDVFSLNRGSRAWFPGGLFGAIKDRLGVEYNIWSVDSTGVINLLSSSADSRGVAAKGRGVRNVFFTGGHYDM